MTGLSASAYLLGEARPDGPPKHALLARTTVAFNPTLQPLTIFGGGETIGAGLLLEAGYALTFDFGFMLNFAVGGLVYLEDTLAGGPLFSIQTERRALIWVGGVLLPLGLVSVLAVAILFADLQLGGLYELLVGPAVVFGEAAGLARVASLRAQA
jgi:hypothetical protein